MTIIRREIEVDVLAQARLFFENSPREESMRMVAAIHEEQPGWSLAPREYDVASRKLEALRAVSTRDCEERTPRRSRRDFATGEGLHLVGLAPI